MKLIKNLRDKTKELHVVENVKWYFLISGIIIFVAFVLMLIPATRLKIGVDFTGGYSVEIKYATYSLNKSNYDTRYEEIRNIVENLKDPNGNPYGIKINNNQMQGTESEGFSILIRFKSLGTDEYMETAIEDICDKLQAAIETESRYDAAVQPGNSISGAVSNELILSAFAALLLAISLMLIYVMFRFEPVAALSSVIALVHDVLIMTSFMLFAGLEINQTYIAAVITIVGYAINNSLIIFDRVRSNMKDPLLAKMPASKFMNYTLKESIFRTVNLTITTLATIVLLAIFGYNIPSLVEFALPIIVGLISGAYSAFCLSPSIWVLLTNYKLKKAKARRNAGKPVKKAAAVK